ncbi:hypothetical protein AB0L25_09100 [Spirillospora sp. NPDC052242]
MDVEDELRRAMAERVADTRAPRSLASDVRRRHRRRKARIRTATAVAGASVAALALVPTYRSIQPAPAGAPEGVAPSTAAPGNGVPERAPVPVPSRSSESGKDGTAGPRTPRPSTGAPEAPASATPRAEPSRPAWLTYLPDGLAAARPCTTERDAARTTTTCEWRGDSGWVRIRLVEGTGIRGPEELAPPVGVPSRTSVRGTPALAGAAPGSGRQVSWLPRPGVGATVQAGGAAAADLMRVAEGVRP